MSEDVNSYELVVTESKGGNFSAGPELAADEWYPAVVKEIKKVQYENSKFGPQFQWLFELQGEEFQIEINDTNAQMGVRGSTSLVVSKNWETGKMSKFYEWYSKVMGSEPERGHKFSTKDLVGKSCYVMVKASQGKDKQGNERTYYNVEKVKSAVKQVAAKPTAVKKAAQVVEDVQPEVKTPAPKVASKAAVASKKSSDVFADVF